MKNIQKLYELNMDNLTGVFMFYEDFIGLITFTN